jgi:hypothetical protein
VLADVGRVVYNSTDKTYTYITAYNSASDVTVQANIFTSGEAWRIFGSKFTAKRAGYYQFHCQIVYGISYQNYSQGLRLNKNGSTVGQYQIENKSLYPDGTFNPTTVLDGIVHLDIGDTLEFVTWQNHGNNLAVDNVLTAMNIQMISED